MEREFLCQVGNSSLDIILYVVILQRGNVLVDFRIYLSTGAVFVYLFFLTFHVCRSLNFPSFFTWTMPVAVTFIMCIDISSHPQHTPPIALLSGY